MMKRREFITLLSGAAAIWPLGTLAQHGAKIPRIGVLMPGHAEGPDASRVMMNAIAKAYPISVTRTGKISPLSAVMENRIRIDFA
jgi:hypothetical protein